MADAHISGRTVGKALIERGHDVLAPDSEPETEGLPDPQVLELTAAEGRVRATANIRDFEPLLAVASAGFAGGATLRSAAAAPRASDPELLAADPDSPSAATESRRRSIQRGTSRIASCASKCPASATRRIYGRTLTYVYPDTDKYGSYEHLFNEDVIELGLARTTTFSHAYRREFERLWEEAEAQGVGLFFIPHKSRQP